MKTRAIQQVSLWLDERSTSEASLAHALEWASCLNLPLRAVAAAQQDGNRRAAMVEEISTWRGRCVQRGVNMETHLLANAREAAEPLLRSGGLCMFPQESTSPIQTSLIEQSSCRPDLCQLFLSRSYEPIHRVLILCDQPELNAAFLETAARLCHALETTPVVLILATSEAEAERKEERAERICAEQRLQADFDSVVYSDLSQAVGRVVTWRSCSHLLIERPQEAAWWARLHRRLVAPLGDLAEFVSILAIPKGAAFEAPVKVRNSGAILPWKPWQDRQHVRGKVTV